MKNLEEDLKNTWRLYLANPTRKSLKKIKEAVFYYEGVSYVELIFGKGKLISIEVTMEFEGTQEDRYSRLEINFQTYAYTLQNEILIWRLVK